MLIIPVFRSMCPWAKIIPEITVIKVGPRDKLVLNKKKTWK